MDKIIKLINESVSIAAAGEKDYWINLLKIMTDEQKQKLIDILEREKRRLAEIRKKYKK